MSNGEQLAADAAGRAGAALSELRRIPAWVFVLGDPEATVYARGKARKAARKDLGLED